MKRLASLFSVLLLLPPVLAQEAKPNKDALKNLKLPGIQLNLKENSVDVTSTVTLTEGSLEFIACTKDTKEHESIIRVEAKPSHIHAALLLLGAKAGNPAIRKLVGDPEDARWIDLPPKGSPISVSLVITDSKNETKELPIWEFISRYDEEKEVATKDEAKKRLKTFLFAGSHLTGGQKGKEKRYLADQSGSVISLSTFGDELLCLPGVYGHENHALPWAVNPENLPKKDSKIILRLRPQKN